MDFKLVFDPTNPAGDCQIIRLTNIGRVGIGTTFPNAKLDVGTASTGNNFYGIYSNNSRPTSGAGGYMRGANYGAFGYGLKNTAGAADGFFGTGYAQDGSGYGIYGTGSACGGSATGIYGTTGSVFNCADKTPAYAGCFDGNVTITGNLILLSDRRRFEPRRRGHG